MANGYDAVAGFLKKLDPFSPLLTAVTATSHLLQGLDIPLS